MLERPDEQYLIRTLANNQVVLFLGAGFSRDAKNKLGSQMPTGKEMAQLLWEWLEYPGDYDGTPLQEMYQAALSSGRKHADLQAFLEGHLLCGDVPPIYDALVRAYWHRIYPTNVDDLVEQVYRRNSAERLQVLTFPRDDIRERDQFLDRIQLIHLNGGLPCVPTDITFSVRQYARRAGSHDPLYHQFAREYAYLPTIFIGTELNEILMWQYIELRQARGRSESEFRPKSFLVAPHISPPRKAQLAEFNVVPVEAYANDFLTWLNSQSSHLPNKDTILQKRAPTFIDMVGARGHQARYTKDVREFANDFHEVPLEPATSTQRSQYLLGTSPRWEDILLNLDAPREITSKLFEDLSHSLSEGTSLEVTAILGHAGCGKSTILRRLGVMLAQAGHKVYLTNSEELPRFDVIARALTALDARAALLFDNAESVIGLLGGLADELRRIEKPPLMVVASRTNDFERRLGRLPQVALINEHSVPNLAKSEIRGVIATLDKNNLLGRLKGMNDEQRMREISVRAHRQILVAMREATSGKGFDEILTDEFSKLEPREAKILYLCTALSTDAGYRLTKAEYIGCADTTASEALNILERTLRDVVLRTGPDGELLLLRHRQIAEFMVTRAAPRPLLRDAYIRLLTVLAEEVRGKLTRSRTFRLYRDLIRHHDIFTRFTKDIDEARSIYDALAKRFEGDAQFWLQYGSLELENGSLDLAESYLKAADSLDPGNTYILNGIGNLLLKKGVLAPNKQEAIQFRDEGSKLLMEVLNNEEEPDPYSYAIYLNQRLRWCNQWSTDQEEKRAELEHLRDFAKAGTTAHPRVREITRLRDDIEREYLSLAIRT